MGGTGQITYDPTTKTHRIGDVSIQANEGRLVIQGDGDYARYETLSAELQALDQQQMHRAANALLLQAMARGVRIHRHAIDVSDGKKTHIKQAQSACQEKLAQHQRQRLLAAPIVTPSDTPNTTPLDPETRALSEQRHTIAADLGRPDHALTEADIIFHQQQGHFTVANYQAALQGVRKAQDNDQKDHKQGVAKTNAKWRANKVSLLLLLFSTLNVDLLTLTGQFSTQGAKQARQAILEDAALVRYITFKLHLRVNTFLSDVAFINKLFKRLLGLRMSSTLIRDRIK